MLRHFMKYSHEFLVKLGTSYNLHSLLHFHSYAMARDWFTPTILDKSTGTVVVIFNWFQTFGTLCFPSWVFCSDDISFICPKIVLKLDMKIFTSLPFRTLWLNWLSFFQSFKKSVYDQKNEPSFSVKQSQMLGSFWAFIYCSSWNIFIFKPE